MEVGDLGEHLMNLLVIIQSWDEPEVRGGSMTFPPALLGNSEHEGTQEVHDGNIVIMWMSVGSVTDEGAFMKPEY